MRLNSWIRGGVGLACAMVLGTTAFAQAQWPERPVRVVVPFPAGGATDLVARVITQRMSQDLGQQMLVDNKAGAGGTIGAAEVARAAPDGNTVLFTTSSTHAISPHLMPRLSYDAVKDFTPVAHLANAPSVLLITSSLPVKNLAEFIAYAKANPGKLNYATSGNGTVVHLNSLAFSAQAGIEMTHVPYKGTSQSIPDLVSGQVQVLFDSLPTGMPHVVSGKVRALGVTSEKRTALAPDLPALAESGVPGFSSVTWFGVYLPAGAPPALAERVNQAFTRAVQSPEVKATLAKQGIDTAAPGTPAQFSAMVKADSARWAEVIRKHKISIE